MPSCFFILYTISVVSGQNEFAERTEEEESRLSKQWCEILFNAMRKLMNHKKVQVIGSLFILISMHYMFELTVLFFLRNEYRIVRKLSRFGLLGEGGLF